MVNYSFNELCNNLATEIKSKFVSELTTERMTDCSTYIGSWAGTAKAKQVATYDIMYYKLFISVSFLLNEKLLSAAVLFIYHEH